MVITPVPHYLDFIYTHILHKIKSSYARTVTITITTTPPSGDGGDTHPRPAPVRRTWARSLPLGATPEPAPCRWGYPLSLTVGGMGRPRTATMLRCGQCCGIS